MTLPFPKPLRSYTFILSVIYASLFCASIIVVLAILYFSSFQFLRNQTDQRIDEDLVRIAATLGPVSFGTIAVLDIKSYLDNRRRTHLRSDPSVYLLVDQNNNFVAGNLQKWPAEFLHVDGDGDRLEFAAQVYHEDNTLHPHPVRALVTVVPNTGGFKLLIGRDIFEIEALKKEFFELFLWSIFATVVLAIVGAYWVSRIVSRRLEKVNALSRSVMEGDLSQRINFDASGDQFDRLSENINLMLERIQSLVEAIRSVSDNIAHDLRTPLTRLRNDLDELARDLENRTGQDVKEASEKVEKAIAEADSLLRTFDALLRIARLENKSFGDTFTEVPVRILLEDLVDLYGPIADSKSIAITTLIDSDSAEIYVDRDAIAQALANLLDNALKYTPQGGEILIEGKFQSGESEIAVTDSGPGIAPEHHKDVLKRFVRLDDASRTTPGNGLGLSLVAAVARMHKLDLVFENANPGLVVRLKRFIRVGHNDAGQKSPATD